jgi:3-dehydroquinate synthase
LDLDRAIVQEAGISIAQIMEQRGEPAFRDLETAALQEIVGHSGSVTGTRGIIIALGGGALLREENRALVESYGSVVLLKAELPTLLNRLKHDGGRRPLLKGDLRERLGVLMDQRRGNYLSFPIQLSVDEGTSARHAMEIQNRLGRFHLKAMGQYDVLIQNGGIDHFGELLRARNLGQPIVVTDENVAQLQAHRVMASLRNAGFNPHLLIIPAGEGYKNLDTVQTLWHRFLESGLDRRSTVIALGGGVIGDLAGFAAATYMRGIHWVSLPTTLLSMVDASLGGKTGFDLPEGKNLIGAFHPPKLVLADPQALETLPEAEFVSGMAEVVKHGIIADPGLFELCAGGLECVRQDLESVVKRAMAVKINIIEEDPYEKGFRAALNLGHTIGHAVELASQFRLRHGEAIAIGMMAEARLAERMGLGGEDLSDRIRHVLFGLGLPVDIPADLSRQEILRAIRVDKKKSANAVRFALPVVIGKVELVEITDLESVL